MICNLLRLQLQQSARKRPYSIAHLKLPDFIKRAFHLQELALICPSGAVSSISSSSPLAPDQAVLGDMAAELNPDQCKRPSGRFHVAHLGLVEMNGDPGIKQKEVSFLAQALRSEEDIILYK